MKYKRVKIYSSNNRVITSHLIVLCCRRAKSPEYTQFIPALGLKKLNGYYQYHQCTECNFGSWIFNLDNYFTSSIPRRRNMHCKLDLFLSKERKQNSVFLLTKFSDKLSLGSSSSSVIFFHCWASLPSSSRLISSNSPSSFSRSSSLASSSIRQKQSQTRHHLHLQRLGLCYKKKWLKKCTSQLKLHLSIN